ncbi:alkylation response protein AidB-like acyl-CoA dehydrogenase [Pseudomonas oryzihabitans]|uniref:Acyl-CoA dehydrogenase family protein n=1 Tax=Pseudomonas flavocrustae TaxID=2991719 RepID=A0ABT6IE28_9PSED|nr:MULTISPECIES: acyl-CoA dehydrogenase family protein [Pseudomonas]MDH4762759.1 acyl-CoA dehydrogenase family protein [Pseudomonas sp. CBMAI 2609]MDK8265697.1 acyl-CoA dehydrogenase family protein [Pseudomonas oryzihabitans]
MSTIEDAAGWLTLAREIGAEFAARVVADERDRIRPDAQLQRLKDSGLTNLVIPVRLGGAGQPWSLAMRVLREIAAGDGSVGLLFGYHLLNTVNLRREPQPRRDRLLAEIAEGRLWLAGVVNPRDDDILATPSPGGGYRLTGRKGFCSGAAFADRLTISALDRESGARLMVTLPADRPGLAYAGDWDHFGVARSDSGSFTLDDVWASAEEVQVCDLEDAGDFAAVIRTPVNQSAFTQYYLGAAQGALREARRYLHAEARPWVHSLAASASEDQLVLSQVGELWIALQGAVALAEVAARRVDDLLDADAAFTTDLRGETAIAVASAKVLAARTALDVTTRVFDALGARATHNRLGLDRFWRDVRTHSLHDPLAYKVLEVGRYAVNGQYPAILAYT